ncbi:protein kinase family protein [Jannaschia ovalis]|uniref:Phosphotransferase enzyme family protein n=1 Tax=Jannaschia ovalis TaxID=3038773 RepID=A0ABY8LE08_9RHOB|nr:hypothetical protein [Jannaschia sp. GRR-S6-38]WGH79555.1 hypothetical protein P8627_04630 [Jannaschia sp. GRR-S6-38]
MTTDTPTSAELDQHPRGSLGWLRAATRDITGQAVAEVTAPGGKGRDSVRVRLEDGRSVIATLRSSAGRASVEALLLGVLSAEGAPVPKPLGFKHGLLLQQDLGQARVSRAMHAAPDAETRARLARAAMDALKACRAAIARRPKVLGSLPAVGTLPGWTEEFVSRSFFLSGDLGIAPPAMDAEAVEQAITVPPEGFTRWDARLANAALTPEGRVVWFDWDMFGRRGGVEDLGWLLADDWWMPDAAASDALLEAALPDPAPRLLARRMALLIAADRLHRIRRRVQKRGWAAAEDALRLDRMGNVPEVVERTAARMAEMAAADPLLGGLSDWFAAAGAAILALEGGTDRPGAEGSG